MKRRSFLKTVGSVAGAAAFGVPSLLAQDAFSEKVAGLPRRPLGKTGVKLSVVGFPGLGLIHDEQSKCTDAVHKAFDRGINYYDVAPAYGNGQCETKLGIALQGLDRDKYFLACKTKKRDAAGAKQELETSLKLAKTDRFDLYQLHHLVRPSEVKEALAPGGALEAILKAKEEGKLKYIGFSAHTTKAALEAMRGYKFDTVMFPINFVEFYTRGFGKDVLALAAEQGASVLAIKPLSWGTWPKDIPKTRQWWYRSVETDEDIRMAMSFALSQSNVVAGIPPSFLDLVDKTITASQSVTPLNDEMASKLKTMAENRESIFLREEAQVAANPPVWTPCYPDSPHECSGGHFV